MIGMQTVQPRGLRRNVLDEAIDIPRDRASVEGLAHVGAPLQANFVIGLALGMNADEALVGIDDHIAVVDVQMRAGQPRQRP